MSNRRKIDKQKYKTTRGQSYYSRSPRQVVIQAPDVEVVEDPPEIRLKGRAGSSEGLTAFCTAGDFEFGPSTNMVLLGEKAKEHAEEAGHPLSHRARP